MGEVSATKSTNSKPVFSWMTQLGFTYAAPTGWNVRMARELKPKGSPGSKLLAEDPKTEIWELQKTSQKANCYTGLILNGRVLYFNAQNS